MMQCPGCGLESDHVNEHVERVHKVTIEVLAAERPETKDAKIAEVLDADNLWSLTSDGIAVVRKIEPPDGGYI